MFFAGLLCVFLTVGAGVLRAQDAALPDSPSPAATVPASVDAPAPAVDAFPSATSPGLSRESFGSTHDHAKPHSSQGISLRERTPYAGGGGRYSVPGGEPDDIQSLFIGTNTTGFGRGSGGLGSAGAHGSAPKLDLRMQGNLGAYLKSSVGNFRFSYQDALGARSNGPGSARATFNSSIFGNGMFNLSESSLFSPGTTASVSHGAFSAELFGKNGSSRSSVPGSTEKHSTSVVSFKLSF
jgi:hypothetical protein